MLLLLVEDEASEGGLQEADQLHYVPRLQAYLHDVRPIQAVDAIRAEDALLCGHQAIPGQPKVPKCTKVKDSQRRDEYVTYPCCSKVLSRAVMSLEMFSYLLEKHDQDASKFKACTLTSCPSSQRGSRIRDSCKTYL